MNFWYCLFSAITVHVMARIRKSREKVAFMVIPLLLSSEDVLRSTSDESACRMCPVFGGLRVSVWIK
uniref:Uncharacterized protein n=1 Tax=Anguilla anguilla TaxID=7936 RepID=A0A0E9TRM5_ANGAN